MKKLPVACVQLDAPSNHSFRQRTYVFATREARIVGIYRAHDSGMGAKQMLEWAVSQGFTCSGAAWVDEVRRKVRANTVANAECSDVECTGNSARWA